MILMLVLFVLALVLVVSGWKMTGQLAGLGIMLVGVALLLAVLALYNAAYDLPPMIQREAKGEFPMDEIRKTGRVTIPTDLDVVPETLEILKKWGADAIRDCDGTDFPQQLKDADAKIYSTYYTTRKDNAWAKANPDEVQQCYIMTGFYTAPGDTVTIPLMKGISPELMQVNTNDDITRSWKGTACTVTLPSA